MLKQIKRIKSLLVSILMVATHACTPDNVPNIRNSSVNGAFDLNILNYGDSIAFETFGATKLIDIEGDTLCFYVAKNRLLTYIMIWAKSATGIQYEYLNYDSLLTDTTSFTLLKKNENILRLPNVRWKPFIYSSSMTIFNLTNDSSLIGYDYFSVLSDASLVSPLILFGLQNYQNREGFLVFRRRYNNTYIYYWLRIRAEENNSFQPGSVQYNGGYSVNFLDGKYQQDSIITGQ